MDTIQKLTDRFSKLPGIGPRQAKRFVYFLLNQNDSYLQEIADGILNLKKDTIICKSCYRFFQSKIKSNHFEGVRHIPKECDICLDPNRDNSVLMVVGKDTDLENIEKNHIFNGKYFILGGYLPIMSDDAPWVRSKELYSLVERKTKIKELEEVVLALSLSPEGENTINFIKQVLDPIKKQFGLKVTTLGRGLSTGTELEYSDDDTLKNALKNRS